MDILYPEALVREWYAAKSTAGSLGDRARQWYVGHHLRSLFGGVGQGAAAAPAAVTVPEPDVARIRRAATLLSRAERPVLLVGSQALLSVSESDALAEAVRALRVPVYLSGMARGLLGTGDPLQVRHMRKEALREADLVILAGVPCDFRLDYGRHVGRHAVLVAANRSRDDIAKNRRPTLAVPGAPELFLRGLARVASGPASAWASWLAVLQARDAARDAQIAAQAREEAPGGTNPLGLCRALEAALDEDSVIVADGGDFVSTASYVLRPRRPLSWLDPGPFGTLGVGAGFALGAKLVRPTADVWVVYGDGSVGYSLAEADTFARHGLGVIAVIGNDGGWTQIAREQVEVLGDDVGTVLSRTDYERAAEGLGARGLRLDEGSRADAVLREARDLAREGRPVYVNARIGSTGFRKGSISM